MIANDDDALAKRKLEADHLSMMKAALSPAQSLFVRITHQGNFIAGEVVPFKKAEPSRPVIPPPQGPRPGTGLPLAAYKAAWSEALAKSGLKPRQEHPHGASPTSSSSRSQVAVK